MQNILNININDYKYYEQIEIEIIPIENISFVNYPYFNSRDGKNIHIYVNDCKEEKKRFFN